MECEGNKWVRESEGCTYNIVQIDWLKSGLTVNRYVADSCLEASFIVFQ